MHQHQRPPLASQAGATPLHETAFNDFEEAAEMLIAAGCDIDPLNVVSAALVALVSVTEQTMTPPCPMYSRVAAVLFTWRVSRVALRLP
eukprot:COSAG06_NODE_306_length_17801_cov_6.989210_8_plen_89_part_00